MYFAGKPEFGGNNYEKSNSNSDCNFVVNEWFGVDGGDISCP
jgi:hypothetical protein